MSKSKNWTETNGTDITLPLTLILTVLSHLQGGLHCRHFCYPDRNFWCLWVLEGIAEKHQEGRLGAEGWFLNGRSTELLGKLQRAYGRRSHRALQWYMLCHSFSWWRWVDQDNRDTFWLSAFSIAVFRIRTRSPSLKSKSLIVWECSFSNQTAACTRAA